MEDIPEDIMKAALECWGSMPKEAGGIQHIAKAILAERSASRDTIDALAAALDEARYAIGSDDDERNWIAINCIDSALTIARS